MLGDDEREYGGAVSAVTGEIRPEATCSEEQRELVLAVCQAMTEIGTVVGTGWNRQQGYGYTSDSDVLQKAQPAMAAAGLMLQIERLVWQADTYDTGSGKAMNRVTVQARYRLTHVTGQWCAIEAIGQGTDAGDKAMQKALTSALKTAVKGAFMVPTLDPTSDPAARRSAPPARAAQPARTQAAAKALGTALDELAHDVAVTPEVAKLIGMPDMAGVSVESLEGEPLRRIASLRPTETTNDVCYAARRRYAEGAAVIAEA